MKTLVVGATGMVGGAICRRLIANGVPVRALVRTTSAPEKILALQAAGVETVVGDLRDRPSLAHACAGVDAVVTTASSMPFAYVPGENDIRRVDWDGEANLINAAKAASVKHFVYTSFSSHIDLDFPLRNAKRAVEKHLKDSGLSYTILRPSYFMEVWLSPAVGFDAANAKVAIYGDGTRPISWIAVDDVAALAVASLSQAGARNKTLELGGPEALTPLQVVTTFEALSGRTFEKQFVPATALEAQQTAASDPMQQSFSGLMRCYAAGDTIEMRDVLRLLPVELSSVRDFARQALVGA